MRDFTKITESLLDYDDVQVNNYVQYLTVLSDAEKKGKLVNPWMKHRTDTFLVNIFKTVSENGLVFDGENITLLSTGVSFNYQAYKNKMLLAYPESVIDTELVYDGDTFTFDKNSGTVRYTHNINNPFDREDKGVIGGYCVIKNKRGEFLTLLNRADIDKHRKVARTDYIWQSWFAEMAKKTLIKKACKQHFDDIYQVINREDNENYDLDNDLDIDLGVKGEIEAIKTVEELHEYFDKNREANKANSKGFNMLITKRKEELEPEHEGAENEDS